MEDAGRDSPSEIQAHRLPGLHRATLARDLARQRLLDEMLCSPAVLLVAVLVFLPVGWLFWLSFFDEGLPTLVHYQRILENRSYIAAFEATFVSSAIVTVLCIVLGYPVAYLLSQVKEKTAALLLIAVLMPFWTSLLVRTYAWLVLLERRGLVNSWLLKIGVIDSALPLVHNLTGTVIGMTHIMLPFMILPLYASMRAIDNDLPVAAESLGASPVGAFWRIFFPLSIPGLSAGTVLVFILCLGFFVTPELLGGGRVVTVPMKIRTVTTTYFDWGAASALGMLLLVLTLGIFAAASKLLGFGRLLSREGL
jgi:ABC-type spermidine/putrescine transport system permease subunit I